MVISNLGLSFKVGFLHLPYSIPRKCAFTPSKPVFLPVNRHTHDDVDRAGHEGVDQRYLEVSLHIFNLSTFITPLKILYTMCLYARI